MAETIVIINGKPGVGKTGHAKRLGEQGFEYCSVPQMLSDYAARHGITLQHRQDWVQVHSCMREELGDGWKSRSFLEAPAPHIAVDGLRSMGDYRILQAAAANNLVSVSFPLLICPDSVRLSHLQARTDPSKEIPDSVEEMLAVEAREAYSDDPFGVGTQGVPDLIPESMHLRYTVEDEVTVHGRLLGLLRSQGILPLPAASG